MASMVNMASVQYTTSRAFQKLEVKWHSVKNTKSYSTWNKSLKKTQTITTEVLERGCSTKGVLEGWFYKVTEHWTIYVLIVRSTGHSSLTQQEETQAALQSIPPAAAACQHPHQTPQGVHQGGSN